MADSDIYTFTVGDENENLRLDSLLNMKIPGYSRNYMASLIKNGAITVSGLNKKPGYRVKPGDEIYCSIPEISETDILPENLPLKSVYDDSDLIIINKNPGMVVHPAPGNETGTLVNAILYHFPDIEGIGGELRPGIVHRLDKDTSGLIVIAKNHMSHMKLSTMFKDRTIRKTYSCLVYGEPDRDDGVINTSIGRDMHDRKKMSVNTRKPKSAVTEWRVVKRFNGISMLSVRIKSGRTHQIRVHLSSIGHPIIGDSVYGRKRSGKHYHKTLKRDLRLKKILRQMLHAEKLTFNHPRTGDEMNFKAEIPGDMQTLVEDLEAGL